MCVFVFERVYGGLYGCVGGGGCWRCVGLVVWRDVCLLVGGLCCEYFGLCGGEEVGGWSVRVYG